MFIMNGPSMVEDWMKYYNYILKVLYSTKEFVKYHAKHNLFPNTSNLKRVFGNKAS